MSEVGDTTLCKHDCGRERPVGHLECNTCRKRLQRLRKKQNTDGLSSDEALRSEISALRLTLVSRDEVVEDLRNRLDLEKIERKALDLAYKNLLEKYLRRESSFAPIGSKSVESIARILDLESEAEEESLTESMTSLVVNHVPNPSAKAVKCGVCKKMRASPLKAGGRRLKNPCTCG